MKTKLKKETTLPHTIIATLLLMTACSNNKQEPIEETPIEPIIEQPQEPQYAPSKYNSPGDTLFINDLQITLDSVSIRTTKVKHTRHQQRMLSVHVSITNLGKETKQIPFLDQIKDERRRTNTTRAGTFIINGNNNDDLDYRIGSRMFFDTKTRKLATQVKPKRTTKGLYSIKYEPHKFSALSFWYITDKEKNDGQSVAMLDNIANTHTVGGESVFQIRAKNAKIHDVGFDITDLLNQEKPE